MSLGVTPVEAAWQPASAQTLPSFQGNTYVLSETQQIKLNLYNEVIEQGLTYSDFQLLVKIARCESGIRHTYDDGSLVLGPDKKDTGLFQIRLPVHEAQAKELGVDILDQLGNIQYAVHLYKKNGVKPWYSSKKCWGS